MGGGGPRAAAAAGDGAPAAGGADVEELAPRAAEEEVGGLWMGGLVRSEVEWGGGCGGGFRGGRTE